jgi:PPOX class probable F420-dependent enzyme
MPMKKSAIEKLLREPNIAVVAVTAPDGSPHAVPTWYEYRAGEVVFHTGPEAFKYKCLEHDPRVTLVVDTKKAPYKCVILKGTAAMTVGPDDARVKRMAIAYLGTKNGTAYAKSLAGERLVIVRFKPERTISWDYAEESP